MPVERRLFSLWKADSKKRGSDGQKGASTSTNETKTRFNVLGVAKREILGSRIIFTIFAPEGPKGLELGRQSVNRGIRIMSMHFASRHCQIKAFPGKSRNCHFSPSALFEPWTSCSIFDD